MPIDLRAFVPLAQGLGAYRKGQMQGEDIKRQREIEDSQRLFGQWAQQRQLDLQARSADQRAALEADRLENARTLRQMQEAGAREREALKQESAMWKNRATFGREGDQQQIGQPERMNTADNAAALEVARIRAMGQANAAAIRAAQGAGANGRSGAAVKGEERLSAAWNRNPAVKNATEIASRVSQMQVAGDGPVGDLSLIFGYMKIVDPTSVVREGEQASARNARGVEESVRNLYNRVLRGDQLTPEQRASFRREATQLARAQRAALDPYKRQFGQLARNVGADSATVVVDPYETVLDGQMPAPAPAQPPKRAGATGAGRAVGVPFWLQPKPQGR